MNKITLLALCAFALIISTVSAMAAPLTVVSGIVTQSDGTTIINGATVTVKCTHAGIDTTKTVLSGADGKYYAFFPALNCAAEDKVTVSVEKDGSLGTSEGLVSYQDSCKINVGMVNVSIPEFGVIAGAIALIGTVGIIAYKRKN